LTKSNHFLIISTRSKTVSTIECGLDHPSTISYCSAH
jgi:hypothetical protein